MKSLKSKKILLASWGCKVKTSQEYRDWPPVFKKIFKKVILFSTKNEFYYFGKEALNKNFLDLLKKEKPDYLLICPVLNEFEIDTLLKIKEITPDTKTMMWTGDDEFRFDDWTRYYALFFDYILTTKKEISIFKDDGIRKVDFMIGVNPGYHRPLNLKEIYDVTFIGAPLADRYDYIKFLMKKGVNIRLFGGGWHKYADLKEIYGGFLYPDDFIKVINQSKINLNFSKTFFKQGKLGQMKGRPIEILACNSFLLTEYTSKTIDFLADNKEMNFRSEEELLKKIKYYLKHEKERKNLAKEGYNHIVKNRSWEKLFTNYFNKIEKDKIKHYNPPEVSEKIITLSENEISLPINKLKEKLKNADYVDFSKASNKKSTHKNYFQSYSLKISKKDISCCDYLVYSESLGDYLVNLSKKSFNTLKKEDFYKILNINQLMVRKNYFLNNLKSFQKLFHGEVCNLLNDKNTVFISIPLVKIQSVGKIPYKDMKNVFNTPFFDKLFSLVRQKKILDPYMFKLFLLSYPGKKFIFKYLFERALDKESWEALNFFN
ncbi:hypothetical protein CMI39_00905 [Candidatus Pacearchaeota archaeon]|jgi:spore maturation protein CgeB|nr:hypothetical protein [Candidatus Pacearchaeota archaeon]|tara:strand:+ start:12021 stop:13655 length:1635 start_codon:yes stop_codon:yes gene_type:complete